jgi:enoyl-CoA hydratase/carnithine racemase
MPELLAFTRMTGDLVKAMRACPQPVVAAIDGVCAGAGAIIAMASDLRLGTPPGQGRPSCSTRVGLAGATWAPARMLPRIVGQGRASELLYTGRAMGGEEGLAGASSTAAVRAGRRAGPAQALAPSWWPGPPSPTA